MRYLDLYITCNDDYHYKSFDKRKEFPFLVINYPNLMGNVPINPSYGVFTSQLIRFSLINQHIDDFTSDVKSLISKLKSQGYNLNRLRNGFQQFVKHNPIKWAHFGVDITKMDFLYNIFNS